MIVISAPPYFPEQVRAIQRQWSEAMLTEADRAHLCTRPTRTVRRKSINCSR